MHYGQGVTVFTRAPTQLQSTPVDSGRRWEWLAYVFWLSTLIAGCAVITVAYCQLQEVRTREIGKCVVAGQHPLECREALR